MARSLHRDRHRDRHRDLHCDRHRVGTRWCQALAIAMGLTFWLPGARAQPSAEAHFVARLQRAVQPPDAAALADLAALPWTFEGRRVDRHAFMTQVVPALFTPRVQRCLRTRPPLREDEALVFACQPHGFVARRLPGGQGWRLVEFYVDVE